MNDRFRLIFRWERGSTFYCVDSETGKPVRMPVGLHVLKDRIALTFSDALDKATAEDVGRAIAACATHLTYSTGSLIVVDGGRAL